MSRLTKEGLLLALLVGMSASIPGQLDAQESEAPPSEEEAPPEEDKDEPPAEEAPPVESKDEIITRDVDGKEWITPDVAAAEEEA